MSKDQAGADTQPLNAPAKQNSCAPAGEPATHVVPVARAPSAAEGAFAEYGKQLILKSAETALDFHKTMLGISATFGTLVSALLPILVWGDKDAVIPKLGGLIFIVPLLLMLLSSLIFAWGYYPRYVPVNINIVEEIRAAREAVITSRRKMAAVGLLLFSLSLMSALGIAVYFRVFV